MRNLDPRQLDVPATLDVQAVERELSQLWKQNASAEEAGEEGAMMRARVLNLMVYVSTEEAQRETTEMLMEVAASHPCRALVMVALREAADRDIEIFVSAYCQSPAGTRASHLCCEQVTLIARGRFAVELPSATTPLLVPDLPVFLHWRDSLPAGDAVFTSLVRASDRVIIDSADFRSPHDDLIALAALLQRVRAAHAALSDLNWTRLTSWRSLLAGFYDVQEYRAALDRLNGVYIEYVAAEGAPEAIAPQALILAGWLASRLDWRVSSKLATQADKEARVALFDKQGRRLAVEFRQVERPEMRPGRLARIELRAEGEPATNFVVSRSEDGRRLETHLSSGTGVRAARVIVCRNRSIATLLSRELAILSPDRIYEQAIALAAQMI